MRWIWVAVAVGGALGSALRFYLQARWQAASGSNFPWGTMGVNLAGSLAIGFLAGAPLAREWRVFLQAGVLGGFTTFSAFSLDNLNLLRAGSARAALANAALSVGGGVALAWAGWLLARLAWRGAR